MVVAAAGEVLVVGERGRVASRPIGPLVRLRREALGMSQEQLAAAVGVQQSYISKIERGTVKLPMRELTDRLAVALELPVSALLEEAGMLDGVERSEAPRDGDDPLARYTPGEIAEIVRHVESRPGRHYRERLAAEKARRSREGYERLCVSMYEAWGQNAELALSIAERGVE